MPNRRARLGLPPCHCPSSVYPRQQLYPSVEPHLLTRKQTISSSSNRSRHSRRKVCPAGYADRWPEPCNALRCRRCWTTSFLKCRLLRKTHCTPAAFTNLLERLQSLCSSSVIRSYLRRVRGKGSKSDEPKVQFLNEALYEPFRKDLTLCRKLQELNINV